MNISRLLPTLTSLLRAGVTAAVLTAFTGCASYTRIADYPTPSKPTEVSVVAKPMSKMNELPIGTYYDEQRHIIVTGHQKGMVAGMLFGVVGVLVTDQMNKSSGAAKYADDSARSRSDLVSMTRELLTEAMAGGHAPNWSLAPTATTGELRLSPYALFTVEKSGDARLYAILRAEILGADGKPTWSGRYFARAPGLHKLDGDNTWMSADHFAPAIRQALTRAVSVCVADAQGRFTNAKPTKVKGRFAYMNMELEWPFLVVEEQPDYVVGRLAAGDVMVMAGTHVLDRTDYQFSPGTFKDPRK